MADNKFILGCTRSYKIIFDRQVVQVEEPRVAIDSSQITRFERTIQALLVKGAIEECDEVQGQFLSSYFLIPKKDGFDQFILNLKQLNKFISLSHFKMEDLRTARVLVVKDCHSATLDIEDAYYLVAVHPSSRKFLRFRFRGRIYQFTCLVFGLCTSPYVFAKVLKPAIKQLRSKGLNRSYI